MEQNRYDHLLQQIAAANLLNAQDLDIDRAYEQLDDYIQGELAGESVRQKFPDVAFFIATDADFAEIYQALRTHAATFDPDAAIEPTEYAGDMAQLEALVAGTTIIIAPEDIVRPLLSPPSPVADEQAYLRSLFPYWEQKLPRFGGIFMSGDTPENMQSIELPDQEPKTLVDLVLSQEESGAVIDGRLQPNHPARIGCPVRLYHPTLQPEPTITCAAETTVDQFGRFEFLDLPTGHYALAMLIEGVVVGIAWLDLAG